MGIKLGGVGSGFKGGKVPDFKPSAPKPEVKPQFTPRPDINGNTPGAQNSPKPGGLGGRLSGVADTFGGMAQGAAGLAGTGFDAASALGMMGPMGPPMMGPGPMMDPQMMGPMGPPMMGPMVPEMMGPPMMGPGPMMDPRMMGPMGPPMMGPMGPPMMGPGPMMDPRMMGPMVPEMMGPPMMGPMGPPMMGPGPMMDPFAAGGLPPELADMPVGDPAPSGPVAADGTSLPQATDTRPQGDTRSAADIVNDSPALANLGRQKDIKFDELCKQTGVDPKLDLKDSRQNPDAVYRLAKVLDFIDSSQISNGGERTGKVQGGKGDGNIEGITKDGDARHGTEAGMVKDFAEKGYASLGTDHRLPTTSDSHVKADGSNKDNFQWFAGEAGKALWFVPGVSNVLTGIGNSEGGALGAIEGGLGGAVKTLKGAAEGVIGSLTTGKINPASALLGAYTGALNETDAAPQVVKDTLNMLPF
jgi:hypothetical protein